MGEKPRIAGPEAVDCRPGRTGDGNPGASPGVYRGASGGSGRFPPESRGSCDSDCRVETWGPGIHSVDHVRPGDRAVRLV